MIKKIEAKVVDENTVVVEMCRFYDVFFGDRCSKGHYGDLKCHEKNEGCPDYKPSIFKREK